MVNFAVPLDPQELPQVTSGAAGFFISVVVVWLGPCLGISFLGSENPGVNGWGRRGRAPWEQGPGYSVTRGHQTSGLGGLGGLATFVLNPKEKSGPCGGARHVVGIWFWWWGSNGGFIFCQWPLLWSVEALPS